MQGNIVNIKRMETHDGDGIRTTLFLKGCPLLCRWCHNPECIPSEQMLGYLSHKCVGCGGCVAVCPTGAHKIENGTHTLDRDRCRLCGKCAEVCPAEALTLYGKIATVEELIPLLIEDEPFYRSSGGGVTISGGEPLMQPAFTAELLKALKERGIHTAVDTSGFAPREALDSVVPYTDLFLFDVKAADEQVHRACTGHGNRLILDNLRYLDSLGKRIEVRYPLVPGMNDGEAEKIAALLASLTHPVKVKVLPYHSLARSKYASLGLVEPMGSAEPPSAEEREKAEAVFHRYGIETVR